MRYLALAILGAATTAVTTIALPQSTQAATLTAGCGTSVSLGTLLGGGSISCDNTLYSDFQFNSSGANVATGVPMAGLPAASIDVLAFTLTTGASNLQFTGGFFAGNNQVFDTAIFYTATALSGAFVEGAIAFNGNFTGTGTARITEQFIQPGNPFVIYDQLGVVNNSITTQLTDRGTLPGLTSVGIAKNILVAGGENGTASISIINQAVVVPEPSLMVGGLFASGAMAYWKRKRPAKTTNLTSSTRAKA